MPIIYYDIFEKLWEIINILIFRLCNHLLFWPVIYKIYFYSFFIFFFIFLDIANHIKGHSKTPKYSQSNLSCFLMWTAGQSVQSQILKPTSWRTFPHGFWRRSGCLPTSFPNPRKSNTWRSRNVQLQNSRACFHIVLWEKLKCAQCAFIRSESDHCESGSAVYSWIMRNLVGDFIDDCLWSGPESFWRGRTHYVRILKRFLRHCFSHDS